MKTSDFASYPKWAIGLMAVLATVWLATSAASKRVSPVKGVKERVTESARIAVASPTVVEARNQQWSGVRGVVNSTSGQAIAGSSVCMWPSEPNFEFWKQRFCVLTDQVGAFNIAVEPGLWLLAVHGGIGLRDLTHETRVTAGNFVPLRLVLSPGGVTLSGRVLDASGGAISGATVTAYPPGVGERPEEPALALAVSDADGTFSLCASEGELDLRVAADGYASALLSTSAPKVGQEVALLPGSSVSGTIVDRAQQPIASVLVQARSERSLGGIVQAVSGSDGSFSMKGVSEGAAYIRLVADDWFADPLRIDVAPSAEQTGVRVVAYRASTVHGTILVDGKPCAAHGQVLLSGATVFGAESQPGGVVRVPGVPPGNYQVRVQCESASELVGEVEVGAESPPFIWRLSRGLSVGVRLDGQGLQQAHHLQVQALGPQSVAANVNTVPSHAVGCVATGAAAFECRGLTPGSYRFSASSDGRVLAEAEASLGDSTKPDIVLQLNETGAVHVRLRDGDPSSITVVADGPVSASAAAAPDGSFWLRFLKPGSYAVRVQGSEAVDVDVVRNAIAEVFLTLPAVEELSGVVLDEDAQPVSNASVVLRRGGILGPIALRQRRTGWDGRFSFDGLMSAQYSVAVESTAGGGEFTVRTARPAVLRVPSAPLLPSWFAPQ